MEGRGETECAGTNNDDGAILANHDELTLEL
jgi:hypothetical protein